MTDKNKHYRGKEGTPVAGCDVYVYADGSVVFYGGNGPEDATQSELAGWLPDLKLVATFEADNR